MKRLQKRIQNYRDRLQQVPGTLPPVQCQRAGRGLKALERLIQDLAADAPHLPGIFAGDDISPRNLLRLVDGDG